MELYLRLIKMNLCNVSINIFSRKKIFNAMCPMHRTISMLASYGFIRYGTYSHKEIHIFVLLFLFLILFLLYFVFYSTISDIQSNISKLNSRNSHTNEVEAYVLYGRKTFESNTHRVFYAL